MYATSNILPILLVLGLLLLYWSRHRTRPAILRSRAPRPWHPAVRIICGLGAVAILVAMTVATWRETQAPYGQPAARSPGKLHLPARPILELPLATQSLIPGVPGAARITPLKDARLLAHLVFLQDECPVYAEDLEIRMPEDAGKKLERIIELAGVRYTVACTLSGLQTHAYEGSQVTLQGVGECSMAMEAPGVSSSRGKGGNFDFSTLTHEQGMYLPTSPWTLARAVPAAPRLVVQATLVGRDDPLREVTLEEFAAATGGFPPAESAPAFVHSQPPDPSMPPAYRMFTILGGAMFLLLLAAGLLAQVFTRRGLAFAGTLALVLLYAAALDRLVLSAHARRLADARQPVAVRCLAAASLPGTVFYQTTAKAALAAMAEDPSVPAPFRAQAARAMNRF